MTGEKGYGRGVETVANLHSAAAQGNACAHEVEYHAYVLHKTDFVDSVRKTKKYRVTVKYSVWTEIEVEATSGINAMAQIEKYGPKEAAQNSTYKVLGERDKDTVIAATLI